MLKNIVIASYFKYTARASVAAHIMPAAYMARPLYARISRASVPPYAVYNGVRIAARVHAAIASIVLYARAAMVDARAAVLPSVVPCTASHAARVRIHMPGDVRRVCPPCVDYVPAVAPSGDTIILARRAVRACNIAAAMASGVRIVPPACRVNLYTRRAAVPVPAVDLFTAMASASVRASIYTAHFARPSVPVRQLSPIVAYYAARRAISIERKQNAAASVNVIDADAAARVTAAQIASAPEKWTYTPNKKMPAAVCDDIYILPARAARAAAQITFEKESHDFLKNIIDALTCFLYSGQKIDDADAADLLQATCAALIDAAASIPAASMGKRTAKEDALKRGKKIDYTLYFTRGIVRTVDGIDAGRAVYRYKCRAAEKTLTINDDGTRATYHKGDVITLYGVRAVRCIAIRAAMAWIDAQRAKTYAGTAIQYKKNSAGDVVPKRVHVPLLPIDAPRGDDMDAAARPYAEIIADEKDDARAAAETWDYIARVLGVASFEYTVIRGIAAGYNAAAIAKKYNVSESKIYRFLSSARKKLVNAGISYKSGTKYDADAAARINANFDDLRAARFDVAAVQNTAAARAHFAAGHVAAARARVVDAARMPGDKMPAGYNTYTIHGRAARVTIDDLRRARAARAIDAGLMHTPQKYDYTRRAARRATPSANMRYYLKMV